VHDDDQQGPRARTSPAGRLRRAKPYFDAVNFHPYLYTLKFSGGVGKPNSPVTQLMQMRQVMTANGDDAKKIWATEYGQPSSTGGEAEQNEYIADILLKWQELPYTGPMFICTTRDRSSGTNTAPRPLSASTEPTGRRRPLNRQCRRRRVGCDPEIR
jgi:hypothetical protein